MYLPDDAKNVALNIKVDRVLNNQQAMNEFIQHLFTEYSIECILSFIEFNGFQGYIISKISDVDGLKMVINLKLLNYHLIKCLIWS